MFNGNDVTGKFPTKFTCESRSQQMMHNDTDWCNIYHVCAGPRDNIFICPPGTVFNVDKQGCFDRYSSQICSGTVNYYKPTKMDNNASKNNQVVQSPIRHDANSQHNDNGFSFGQFGFKRF